jgi:hypothetical protein
VSFANPFLWMHASIGRGSGTIALASAHTSCLRQIVKEQSLTEAAGRPGSITRSPAPSKPSIEEWNLRNGRARIIGLERRGTSPSERKFDGTLVRSVFDRLVSRSYSTPRFRGWC